GEEHRNKPGVGSALHVVLPAQGMQAGARTANLAADKRERNETARIVGAVRVLRHTHAPEDDGTFGTREATRNLAQRIGGNAANRVPVLPRRRRTTLREL